MGRFAYLIGSEKFTPESGLRGLVGPREDVRALREELCRPDRGDFQVMDFIDCPTYEIARQLYADLAKRTNEDVILVYFSGHGLLDEDGHLFLSGSNTEASNVAGTGLRALDVLGRMQKSGALRRILLLDCCYSGAIGSQWTKDDASARRINEIRNISRESGTYVLTSSTDVQVSHDGDLSLFTKTIVDGIKTGEADLDHDGEISLTDLSNYTSQRVPVEAGQNPTQFDLGGLGRFVISKSGRSPLKERRLKLRERLEEDRKTDRISNELYTFVFSRFDEGSTMPPESVNRFDLFVDRLLNEKITLGAFYENMVRLKVEAELKSGKEAPPQPLPAAAPPQPPSAAVPPPPRPADPPNDRSNSIGPWRAAFLFSPLPFLIMAAAVVASDPFSSPSDLYLTYSVVWLGAVIYAVVLLINGRYKKSKTLLIASVVLNMVVPSLLLVAGII